jgi:hypothetical protein
LATTQVSSADQGKEWATEKGLNGRDENENIYSRLQCAQSLEIFCGIYVQSLGILASTSTGMLATAYILPLFGN